MTQIKNLERDLRFLKIYAGVLTILCAILFAWLFKLAAVKRFDEIDVGRINVVERDGRLRLVISNQANQHPGVMDGVTYDERKGQRPPGLMFFGENGNEVGGLVFDGTEGKGQGGSLTFDKFRGDQTIQFLHDEDADGRYFSGLKMSDQNMPLNDLIKKQKEIEQLPSKEAQDAAYKELREQGLLMVERVRIGKERDKSSILRMKDAKGRMRIEMKVEADGSPKLTFFDAAGKASYSLPPSTSSPKQF